MKPLLSFAALSLIFLPWIAHAIETAPVRPTVNVKDFGAKGDCQRVTDGAMRKGSLRLTSASAQFSPNDVGKPIYVLGAGAQRFPELGEVPGAPLDTRIASVTDAHTVTLADAARQDVAGVSVTWGADDSDTIQRAIDSLSTNGGDVFFPAGTYRVTYHGGPGLKVAGSNIRLHGVGDESAIFNSTVIFHAKLKDGVIVTEQAGVPVLYAGQPKVPVENVEIDHLWLGDNGQNYDFKTWGPHGPGVLGTAGKIDRVSFHDLTIETTFLCGVNTNSETNGCSIHHLNILNGGEHGMYLAGTGSDFDVHDNRLVGTTAPMRQGIAVKKKNHIRVTHNELSNIEFQAIGVEGDDLSYISRDVLIADNWIHDIAAWHTDAITIFNAEDVVIRNNRIADVSWIGISLRTWKYSVTRVLVKDNIITRAGKRDPAFAIAVHHDPPRDNPSEPWPGRVGDITIEGNIITDCTHGISFAKAAGHNVIRGNRVENHGMKETAAGYQIDAMPESKTEFRDNIGVNCARYIIAPNIVSANNDLK